MGLRKPVDADVQKRPRGASLGKLSKATVGARLTGDNGGANPDEMSPAFAAGQDNHVRYPRGFLRRELLLFPELRLLLRGRAQAAVAFLHEKAPYLDGAAQFAAADEALVEHVLHDFQQDSCLRPVE